MPVKNAPVFSPDIPPDLDHALLIREEALDWIETHFAEKHSLSTSEVLKITGETGRRWLISRLRQHSIGDEVGFSLPDAADALSVLYLRARGVKFRDAIDAITRRTDATRTIEPRYGGLWNRLIISTMERLRRRVPPRLIGSAVSSLIKDLGSQVNCLIIVKRLGQPVRSTISGQVASVTHDYVYRKVLERPAPSCLVISPSHEVLFLSQDQLPARSEITSRHFVSLQVKTDLDWYEMLLGTMTTSSIQPDVETVSFIARILDIVFIHFDAFLAGGAWARLETPIQPEPESADDLQLWLTTQFLTRIYPGSLCEITETSPVTHLTKVLANSSTKPWEPSPWEPAKSLEMLSGYTSLTSIPLVVEKLDSPWTSIVEGIDTELRYVKSLTEKGKSPSTFSVLALPITLSTGRTMGSLYLLTPQFRKSQLVTEVRILSVFSRIIGETIERQRAAVYSARYSANIMDNKILKKTEFKAALLALLSKRAVGLNEKVNIERDLRLPFLLLATHTPEAGQVEYGVSTQLRSWLVQTMTHIEWRSFIRSHWPDASEDVVREGFIGEVPGVGMMIALGHLVSKDELDRIRNAFPTTINRTTPTNAPVKFVAWVLDMPAQRIVDAAKAQNIPALADEIEGWAFQVTTLVDDLAQISSLAREEGQWDAALRRIRQALQKPGARNNPYLPRLAADCSLSLGDWPSALKYAHEAVNLSRHELGSGHIRSLCLEGDAHLCLCNPDKAWDLYSEAAIKSPSHPLPLYYRGQALLLIARLLRVHEDDLRRASPQNVKQIAKIDVILNIIIDRAMDDLTLAADLLDRWGLIPESYQYRNFHLVPTLVGQGTGYLLVRAPGPAASRLQSARRSFPKDDLFFREFLFAKCWEQGIHRQYAELLCSDGWKSFSDRLQHTYRSIGNK